MKYFPYQVSLQSGMNQSVLDWENCFNVICYQDNYIFFTVVFEGGIQLQNRFCAWKLFPALLQM